MKTNNREVTDENAPAAVKVTSGRHESDSWPTPTENTQSTE